MFLIYFISLIGGLLIVGKPLIGGIILVLLSIYFFKNREKKTIIFSILFFALGMFLYLMAKASIFHDTNIGIVILKKDNYIIVRSNFSYFYISSEENSYEVFDFIKYKGTKESYNFTNYESRFDFNSYLEERFVFYKINTSEISTMIPSILRINSLIDLNFINYNEVSKNMIGQLVFNKSYDDSYSKILSDNNFYYLLSSSSLHIYFIDEIIIKILKLKKVKPKNIDFSIIISNILLFILSNYKNSIFKIIIFYLLQFYFENKKKITLNYIDKISLGGLIFLLIKPYYIYSNSFIYSFIILYWIYITRGAISTYKKKYQFFIRIIYIYLFFIPLFINNSYSLTPLTMVFTIGLTPFIEILYLLGILGIFIPLYFIINPYCSLLYKGLTLIDYLNIKIPMGGISYAFIIIYYVFLLLLIFVTENKDKFKKSVLSYSLIGTIFISSLPISNSFICSISFINVGQGDSTLIQYHNTNILVDTGGIRSFDIATETLIPYFRKNHVYKLDYVFITHTDFDHYGGFTSLKENFRIENYNQDNLFTSIEIGELTFYNLNPCSSNEENENSLVLYFTINNKSILLMGDAPSEIETKIIKNNPSLKTTYLKVGHHGSKYSTSSYFISYVQPETAIISCGRNNYYGHPHEQVLEVLNTYNVKIRRTDQEGTIKINL